MSDNELHTKLIKYPKKLQRYYLKIEKSTNKPVNAQIREILELDYARKKFIGEARG